MKRPPLLLLLLASLILSPATIFAADFGLEQFFDAVQDGDVENLMKAMHPQLAERIDPPIMEAWLQAVAYRLGRVEVITPITDVYEENRLISTAEITFTKGIAEAELAVMNGAIVEFEIKSDRLTNWFQQPTSLQLYREKGEKFLSSLLSNDFTAARKVLHEKISQQVTDQHLISSLEIIEERIGEKSDVTYEQARLIVLPDERLRQIDLIYEIKGQETAVHAELAIRFYGMQGHIVGFRFVD